MSCRFPDISAFQNPPKGEMNMVAGDFSQIYGDSTQENQWDCVCCCFFIDCANNIVEFLEIIYKILKPGGIFINFGPLLYHFCDVPNEFRYKHELHFWWHALYYHFYSLEPSYEDLREIISKLGFTFLKEETKVKAQYSQNALSMSKMEYEAVFFVCKKNDKFSQ